MKQHPESQISLSVCLSEESLLELNNRGPGWWPGTIMSPSGFVTGLVGSDSYLPVLGSFGCQWPLAGCRSMLCTEAEDPSVMVEPSSLHRKKATHLRLVRLFTKVKSYSDVI